METKKRRFRGLFKEVKDALKMLEKRGSIKILKECISRNDRYNKLIEILPDVPLWETMSARQLLFCLQRKYELDFGVCSHYVIEGNKQYCTQDGKKSECDCGIPQINYVCVFRNKGQIFLPIPSAGVAY